MASFHRAVAVLVVLVVARAWAHEHHEENIPEGQMVSVDPIDSILWTHIIIQTISWGVIFPTGMVLGMTKSRWHIPVQALGTTGAIVGYFLGHAHKGRQFKHNIHSTFARYLQWYLFVQIAVGIYLRLHIERGLLGKLRPYLVRYHGLVGKIFPLAVWVQLLFGGIVALGFCSGEHLGQCAAHFIMGSAFIAYGILLTILLLVGQAWLRWTNRSQEFFDSAIIAAWGCVNTFTEHHWGGPWVRNDLQHTSMGIIWWAAGLVGMWLSRGRDGRPKRNLIPAIVIILTGWGMSAHPQELMISNMVHSIFGYTLMAAGGTRIIEISFVLRDRPYSPRGEPYSFQFLTPFLLYASGMLFMSATEEQMALMATAGVTHVSYILILYSAAFIMFLFVNVLLQIVYNSMQTGAAADRLGSNPAYAALGSRENNIGTPYAGDDADLAHDVGSHNLNGTAYNSRRKHDTANGSADARRMRDAQEFELDAFVSDDEDDTTTARPGLASGKMERGLVGDMD